MSIYDAPAHKSPFDDLGVFASVGLLFLLRRPEWLVPIGTAFCYEDASTFLTAAHVVRTLLPGQLAILCGRATFFFGDALHVHPTADLAVIRVRAGSGAEALRPFRRTFQGGPRAGTRFHAFGFPEDVRIAKSSANASAVPRVFMGHVQRLIPDYVSASGYSYLAAEMSIPAPPGLSGGPIFPQEQPSVPYGLVADNLEVGTQLFESETTDEAGVRSVLRRERVITYGVAALIAPLQTWIDSLK